MLHKICPLTQSPEKYLCLNEECYTNDKKQVQCYECLNKQHIGKNKMIKHFDDFIDLDKFMKTIHNKCAEKSFFIEQLILQILQFQKEKVQQIELKNTKSIAKEAIQKIEKEISCFTTSLNEEISNLQIQQNYSPTNHLQFIKLYLEKDENYIENFRQKYKQLVQQIECYIINFNVDINLKLEKLQEEYSQLQKKLSNRSFVDILSPYFTLLIFLTLPLFYYYLQYQIQIIDIRQITNNLEINKNINELILQIDKFEQQSINNNTLFDIFQEPINDIKEANEKLKLRFDTYKRSQSTLQDEISQNLKKIQSQFEKYQIQQEQINEKIQNRIQFLNITLVEIKTTILQQQKENDILYQISNNNNKQVEIILEPSEFQTKKDMIFFKNKDLIGNIHLNLNLNRLKDFTIIYDELFTKYFSFSMMDKLLKIVFADENDPIVCIGGMLANETNFMSLAGCDFASEAFQLTNDQRKARKSKYGNIYWYQVDFYSFGFAPNEQIQLNFCDDEDLDSDQRFSYWYNIRGHFGGRRIGKQNNLENSTKHRMRIYMFKWQ